MNNRFHSLDVFRGATVALMILVNNPGSWSNIYAPLDHAEWHGCTPTDLVFPFFLFAVGNAMAFVMPRLEAAGDATFWKKILTRTALIFLIGLFLNWFPFIKWDNDHLAFKQWEFMDAAGKPAGIRILGVLQRIALAYFFASVIIYYFKLRGAFFISAIILLGYWFLCMAANPSDPFSIHGWFGTSVDKKILGTAHLYTGEGFPFDPEGLMSLFTAIVQVIFGYIAGNYIAAKGRTAEMLNGLFVAACVMIFTGFCWDMVFPINKKIWTSSYTVYTTGLALLVIAIMIYIIDFKQRTGLWSRFFDVFGKNALFIFFLSGTIPRLLALIRIRGSVSPEGKQIYITPRDWFYEHIGKTIFAEPKNASLLYALCFIVLMWFLAWMLDRKKIYIKV